MFRQFASLVARDDAPDAASQPNSHTMVTLLVVLLVLVILAVLLVAGLMFLRARKRARKQQLQLPMYDEKRASTASSLSTHRRVLVRPSESAYVLQEKQEFMDDSTSPPPSPLPEIRITFPEEFDKDTGKRQSGRVVVVRVGDAGVGLEPMEELPAYQKDENDRFHSIDLERVGGLVEKAKNAPNKEYQ